MDQIVWNLTPRSDMVWGLCTSNRFLMWFKNGVLAAILDVNTLGTVTRTKPTRFLSNLVQRESLGGPRCIMPIYFLFDFKNGDMAAMITLVWHISRKLCKIGYYSYHYSYIGSHIWSSIWRHCLWPERSIQVTHVFNGLYLQIYSR